MMQCRSCNGRKKDPLVTQSTWPKSPKVYIFVEMPRIYCGIDKLIKEAPHVSIFRPIWSYNKNIYNQKIILEKNGLMGHVLSRFKISLFDNSLCFPHFLWKG